MLLRLLETEVSQPHSNCLMCVLHLEQDPLRHSGAQVMHGLELPQVGTGRDGQ